MVFWIIMIGASLLTITSGLRAGYCNIKGRQTDDAELVSKGRSSHALYAVSGLITFLLMMAYVISLIISKWF